MAHLSCLAKYFLESSDNLHKTQSNFIPRGGHCPSCSSYTLWGDVIRGSYHRFRALNEAQVGSEVVSDVDDLTCAKTNGVGKPVPRKIRKRPVASQSSRKTSSRTARKETCIDSETSAVPVERKRGPCQKTDGTHPSLKMTAGTPSTKRILRRPPKPTLHENIDLTLTSLPELYDVPLKRKRGRPRKLLLSSNAANDGETGKTQATTTIAL